MQERRKLPRKDLMSYSQVFDLYRGKLIGYLGDLNLIGAMVIGDSPMKLDEKITISIQLPELPNISATRLALPVRIVWCQPDLSPEYFNIGMEFGVTSNQVQTFHFYYGPLYTMAWIISYPLIILASQGLWRKIKISKPQPIPLSPA